MSDDQRFQDRTEQAFSEMTQLLMRKRQAYGTTNLTRFGGIGIVIRASDKIDRLSNLYQRQQGISADGESVEDAWKDLIGYGLLGLLHHREAMAPADETPAEGDQGE